MNVSDGLQQGGATSSGQAELGLVSSPRLKQPAAGEVVCIDPQASQASAASALQLKHRLASSASPHSVYCTFPASVSVSCPLNHIDSPNDCTVAF